jgi:hypothetical protein
MRSRSVGWLSKTPFDFSTENSSSQKAFQCLQVGEIIVGQETNRFAHGLSTAGTADPVDVILGMTGEVIINHVGNAFHIDSASSDVGCDEDADTSRLEILKGTETLILRAVGVESRAGDS